MNLYEVVGSQEEGQTLHSKTEKVTHFNEEEEEYTCMSLHDPQQEGSSRYQEPQWCVRNTKAAVSNDESKQPSDCQH